MVARSRLGFALPLLALTFGGGALAAPGDIHRVTGAELVNLRAGPSDEANVRGRVEAGDEVIELTNEGNWVGVRVLPTGEEGWIYGGLLERTAASGLSAGGDGGGGGLADAGFLQFSEGFNTLIHRINQDLGYGMVADVVSPSQGVLRVTPSAEWLRSGSRDAHVMAATAFYQMWKNHQNGARVTSVLTDAAGDDYVTIADTDRGPELTVGEP